MITVIDDETPDASLFPSGFGRGLELTRSTPFGEIPNVPPFPSNLLIPENEWQGRIEEMVAQKSRLSDLARILDVGVLHQEETNYCWFNSPAFIVMLLRAMQGQANIRLSPASGAAQITGYRNVGGYGEVALRWIIKNGICPQSLWPANAIDRQYHSAATDAAAKEFRIDEWFDIQPRNKNELISCLLRRIPVSIGLNWWRHQVTAMDAVWLNGTIAINIANSWGTGWGTNGYGILQGNRMLPDDAVAPATVIASQGKPSQLAGTTGSRIAVS